LVALQKSLIKQQKRGNAEPFFARYRKRGMSAVTEYQGRLKKT
jgi:hypothetical protein